MPILGIDLGTTNSLACVFRNGHLQLIPNRFGQYKTPSVVHIDNNQAMVGQNAKNRLLLEPQNTAASFKVWMGTNKKIMLNNTVFSPEELSALVLKQLVKDAEDYLGEPIAEAVISVPAYFNDNQRCATKLAAQMAGLTVERLVNEPSAAALYHQNASQIEDGTMLMIDFGGGTLDVSIVECFENIIEIIAVAGDNHLGGNDADKAIASYFCSQNNLVWDSLSLQAQSALLYQCEQAKIALSSQNAAMLVLAAEGKEYSLILTNESLMQICKPIFERILGVIRQALKNADRQVNVDAVVMVGGSSNLKVLVDFLEQQFHRRPLTADNPDQTIALGVGMCAAMKERAEQVKELIMTDVCPFSLGTAVYNRANPKMDIMSVLIPRSTMLPASHQEKYFTVADGQEKVRIGIYQGEQYYTEQNLKLGEIEVNVPPAPAGKSWVSVNFAYDINGILCVSVKTCTGEVRELTVLNPRLKNNSLQIKQAEKKLKEMQLIAETDSKQSELLERLLALFGNGSFSVRWYVEDVLMPQYQTIVRCNRMIEREKRLRELWEKVKELEQVQQEEIDLGNIWSQPMEWENDWNNDDWDDEEE